IALWKACCARNLRFTRPLLTCITFLRSRLARRIRLLEEWALSGNSSCRARWLWKRNPVHSARILSLLLLAILPVRAQRLPVLKQIDLPHSAYYREMYLPQLTSGPSSVAWMPDSGSIIFSMQGFLWRQDLNSSTAEQLTDGPGYDYQPDVSAD